MKNLIGSGRRDCFGLKRAHSAAILASALAVAGCSADVTRFDSASFNLNDPPEAASAPVPQEPVHSSFNNSVTHSQPRGPYGAGAKSVEVAALPEPVGAQPLPPPAAQTPATAYKQPPYRPAAAQPFAGSQPAHANTAAPSVAAGPGGTIDVQPGDTLFGLAKRHRVSVAELKAANGLSTDSLKLGQKLQLPGGRGAQVAALAPSAAPAAAQPTPSSAPAVAEPAPMAPAAPEVMARYNSTHTVQAGESLYAIARQHKINFGELQQVNGISDPRKVRPGTVLKVPAGSAGTSLAAAQPAAPVASPPAVTAAAQPAAEPSAQPSMAQNTSTQPTVINGGNKRVAALGDRATDASAPAAAPAAAPSAAPAAKADKVAAAAPHASADASDSVKLRWPATGKIIAGFGGRPDGTHNDGINLSVPLGTDVHAAESGVVAYAGSELKGYGNLVLVRHDNGWVTAYAHNDELLVKRGDKVKRGQVIGKAGKTGTVDQPQVHFELRQGSKPVDPTPFMEKI